MFEYNENIQLAENASVVDIQEAALTSFDKKRELLEKTKIVKQTWSIIEIVQKIRDNNLILDPDYQRNDIWKDDKKTAFIESLYMGIIIPPVYVVEIPSEDVFIKTTYEVVDGKQRLSTILNFVNGDLKLQEKSLEYYSDLFANKKFPEIRDKYKEQTSEMLSSVLDVYVITANSPEFTKYDIFSRLNKGSATLKVNEIRKAIYRSHTLQIVDEYVKERTCLSGHHALQLEYKELFSDNDIQRYEDYGRFYRSIAFYVRTDRKEGKVKNYNSRPREMINNVLQDIQDGKIVIEDEIVKEILDKTIVLLKLFEGTDNKDYYIDMCIPYVLEFDKVSGLISKIKADVNISNSFIKSPATTTKVNDRVKRMCELMGEYLED